MKTDIHPDYHFVSVRLADGTEYTTRSTMKSESYVSEVDSSNHPFYTGKRTMVDTAGRVEKFMRRYGTEQAKQAAAAQAEADADRAAKEAEEAAA
jgi:large subunit ribosomal protein L31